MTDLKAELMNALKTGDMILGSKNVIETLFKSKAKLVIVSDNCPLKERQQIVYYTNLAGIPCKIIKDSSVEVGAKCGKSYPVSSLAVVNEGSSSILKI